MAPLILPLLAAVAAGPAAADDPPELRALADPLGTLEDSDDPDELVAAAQAVCDSLDYDAIDQVVTMVCRPSLQDRLDSRRDYRSKSVEKLNVTRVLLALARLPDGLAEPYLGACARDPCFMRRPQRVRALVYAAGELRRPSPWLLRFLDDQSAAVYAESGVVRTLARLATDDSCALIEKRLLSPDRGPYAKAEWLYQYLAPVRDRPAVVALYRRLLAADLDDDRVREALVRSLFDDRPRTDYDYSPSEEAVWPRWRAFPTPVLRELLHAADEAERLNPSADAKAAVAKARKEIEALVAERNGK
jgi:hypothetical protein